MVPSSAFGMQLVAELCLDWSGFSEESVSDLEPVWSAVFLSRLKHLVAANLRKHILSHVRSCLFCFADNGYV